MIIRASNENDITRIFQIEKSVFLESAWFRKMIVNELLKKSDRYTWIIENEKELIGYCMIRFGPGEVHLINMAIAPSFQQKGLGRNLLQYFLNNIPKLIENTNSYNLDELSNPGWEIIFKNYK